MENKTLRLWIRLTPKEKALFKSKASKHSSISAMVRDAVMNFNPLETKGKMGVIQDAAQTIRNASAELNRIGNNVNQIAHVLNYLMLQGDKPGAGKYCTENAKHIEQVLAATIGQIEVIKATERKIYSQLI